jgi:glucose/arabinose dehydrogenase
MRKLAVVLAAGLLVAVPPLGDEPAAAVGKQRLVGCGKPNACWITAFAFTPDGTELFYAERFSGEIRRVNLASGNDTRYTRIRDVASWGDHGVLGIAVDPDWASGQQRVFVYYTEAHPQKNRIVRLEESGSGQVSSTRLATIPATGYHDGGTLHFGPDGKLYAVTGDAAGPGRSQRVGNLSGKVLRMDEDGSRPGDNPFRRGRAFSIGHRNSFGFAFDPQTGRLWQTENGPECDDEINLVRRGRNYGWGPASECPNTNDSGRRPVKPKWRINPLIAPTGAAFCRGCGLGPKVNGDLLIGTYLSPRILDLSLNAKRNKIVGRRVLVRHGRVVLAVEAAPDGRVYFSDLRGIYRLT